MLATPQRHLPWLLLLCLLALQPTAARAQEPTPEERQRMTVLNERGFEAFQGGRYEQAARLFRQAYAEVPEPNLRKSEAIAWLQAGRCTEAVEAAKAFLIARETAERDRREARAIVAICKLEAAGRATETGRLEHAEHLLGEVERLGPSGDVLELYEQRLDELARARQLARAKVDGDAPPGPTGPGDDGELTRQVGWITTGTGVALLATAVVYHVITLDAQQELIDISQHGGDGRRHAELSDRVATARWLVPSLYLAGAATTGVGAYLVVSPEGPIFGGGSSKGLQMQAGFQVRF